MGLATPPSSSEAAGLKNLQYSLGVGTEQLPGGGGRLGSGGIVAGAEGVGIGLGAIPEKAEVMDVAGVGVGPVKMVQSLPDMVRIIKVDR